MQACPFLHSAKAHNCKDKEVIDALKQNGLYKAPSSVAAPTTAQPGAARASSAQSNVLLQRSITPHLNSKPRYTKEDKTRKTELFSDMIFNAALPFVKGRAPFSQGVFHFSVTLLPAA